MPLPSFFVIGGFRCGTTSLHDYLRQHPGVFVPTEKEPNYLAIDGNPDVSKVLLNRSVVSMDAYLALYRKAQPGQVLGDISPEYLRNPWASRRISELVPDARLIAILRNPIDRAWSDFLLHSRDGDETASSFAEALSQQETRQKSGDHRAAEYIESGLYASQLQRYRERFRDDQLLVVLFEDLVGDTEATMARIFEHIGADPTVKIGEISSYNSSGIPKSRPVAFVLKIRSRFRPFVPRGAKERLRPVWERFLSGRLDRPTMTAQDRAALIAIYRDDVSALSAMLGRDLSHWLEP